MNGSRPSRRIPVAPALLGAAGLLPPIFAIAIRLSAGSQASISGTALKLAILYALLIVSFLGGIWWGAAASKGQAETSSGVFALSVVPTLAAFTLFALASVLPLLATVLLAILIAVSPVGDAWLCALDLMPGWWMRLRLTLSLSLSVLVLILAALLAI